MSERTLGTRHPGYVAGLQVARRISGLTRLGLNKLLGTAQPSDCLLSIEERLTIGPKKTLVLVNCCGRRFLLAIADDAISPMIEVRSFVEDGSRSVEGASITKQEGSL